jgi:hypothetical protein
MNSTQTLPFDSRQTAGRGSHNRARLFYSAAAALLLLLAFVGFRQFYLYGKAYPGRELAPPIRTLLIVHGVAMSAWMLLFMAQPLLIVTGNRRVHIVFGRAGAVLAVCIVFMGLRVAIESVRITPPDTKVWELVPHQFLALPIFTILSYAGYVFAGVWNRQRPEIHRPMMLLSVLALMPAPMDRIDAIQNLYTGTIWGTIFGAHFSTLVIGLLFLIVKWRLTRAWDRWFAVGYACLVVTSALMMAVARSSAWEHFASLLLR